MKKVNKVKSILIDYPETRSSDYELYWKYTQIYQKKEFMLKINNTWFIVIDKQNMPKLEILNHSILAIRQRLQLKHSSLRNDETWIKRHKKSVEDKTKILNIK